ncbi:WD repeat RAPTOR family protein [Pleurotus pulmonarius]|nr:hypothetical protein EYR36_008023 [Pleurotus pulmonarius]
MANHHARDGPRFATGAGPWSSRDNRSSDSSTERDYQNSDPSSYAHSNPPSNSNSRSIRERNDSPDTRLNGSIETSQEDMAPPMAYWQAKRHLTCGNPSPTPPWLSKPPPWRGHSPGKLKTANAALVICLNIDVDPPDVVKTNPCAIMETWIDPHTMPSHKALEAIGTNLQHQFEGLSNKMVYKPILDPCFEDLSRFCRALRKSAKEDAVLFYYNGHGVPKPTASGELWCFNKSYTQYIPVSLSEVQTWLGSPGVYIWDCSAAGNLLTNFNVFAERRDREILASNGIRTDGSVIQPYMSSVQLAACMSNETLPTCPELPADLFTSCLTAPIDTALRYFLLTVDLPAGVTPSMVLQIPGDLKDRRTPLGELNWIFTAITDTIAWTTFSRELFTRLYRCDLLIASLFRNFLLAERIMKSYGCTPHTYPPLPPTNTHNMWAAWDLALDTCIRQLPKLLNKQVDIPVSLTPTPAPAPFPTMSLGLRTGRVGSNPVTPDSSKPYTYINNKFFTDQLKAFEVWISKGGSALTRRGPAGAPTSSDMPNDPSDNGMVNDHDLQQYSRFVWSSEHLVPRKPPDQLPIVLQVLLSQPHRLHALILLSQFVDLGPWAVHLVLSIGIFPYILKLLGAAGTELRPVLIFIWARILAVDHTVQQDLVTTPSYLYFTKVLSLKDDDASSQAALPNSSEHKAMCAFILSAIARGFPHGQSVVFNEHVFDYCHDRLDSEDFLLRQWAALCIAQIWCGNDEAKIYGVDRGSQDTFISMLTDDACEVRCAALYALGTFMGASGRRLEGPDDLGGGGGGTGSMHQLDEVIHFRMEVAVVTGASLAIQDDASPMCRKELVVLISCLVKEWRGWFVVCAWIYWEEDRRWRAGAMGHHDEDITGQAVSEWLDSVSDDNETIREEYRLVLTSVFTIYAVLLDLAVDPYHEVATNAQTVVDYVTALLLESPFTRLEGSTLDTPPIDVNTRATNGSSPQLGPRARVMSTQRAGSHLAANPPSPNPTRPALSRSETMTSTISSGVSNTIKRTSSFANVLKNLAGGIAFPSTEEPAPNSPNATLVNTTAGNPITNGTFHGLKDNFDVSRPPSPNLNFAQYTSPYPRSSTPPMRHSTPSVRSLSSEVPHSPVDISACDVMDALFEDDMERLRARRRAARKAAEKHHHHSSHTNHSNGSSSPCNSTFSQDSGSSVILGLGYGAGIKDILPLRSAFYDWCCEYFTEPQMRQTEADEPGSIQYNYQVWRQQRNENTIDETTRQAAIAEHCRWDRPVASLHIQGHPLTMAFHAYDQHLIIANEADSVTVWDWTQKTKLSQFCNGNPKGTSITSLHIVNQDVGGLILTGTSDGVVRLYRNYDPTMDQAPVQMVSSFRGLQDILQVPQGSGMVTEWRQSGAFLFAGGDSKSIRIWDVHMESHHADISTEADSPTTSIVSDRGTAHVFAASFADGSVRIFDRRMAFDNAVVRQYSEHTSWVQNVRWHPTSGGQFFSASLDGEVKLWDLRGSTSSLKTWNLLPNGISAFDVHPHTHVFAATSAVTPVDWKSQRTVVHSFDRELSKFNVSTGLNVYPPRPLPSAYIPRSTSLVFHPTEMLYGLGEPDGTVRIIGCKLSQT